MNYCIFDLETTVFKSRKRNGNPFDARNKMIVSTTLEKGGEPNVQYEVKGIEKVTNINWDNIDFLIGHNIKYDLLYIWDDEDFQQWLLNGGRVWDTQTAEYLITGQKHIYSSLNDCAEKYGGNQKDDVVAAFFEEGIGSDEIPEEILLPYAKEDVLNTEIVFLGQLEEADKYNMMPILLVYMEHYLALCEMERNGMSFDAQKAEELQGTLEGSLESLGTLIIEKSKPFWTDEIEFNPANSEHVSALIFGGDITITRDVPRLDKEGNKQYYSDKAQKAGQLMTRKEKCKLNVAGFGVPKKYTKPTKKEGVYSSDKEILEAIKPITKRPIVAELISSIIEHKEIQKYLSTYLYAEKRLSKNKTKETGFIPLVYEDGCIHGELDCVQTKTGRLNSKNPNIQNIPRPLTELFKSRYPNGKIICADFSQLEVCVQAYLTQSTKMIKDITDGIDFHCKRLAYAEEIPYEEVVKKCKESDEWKAKRTSAKTISFQKAYGAMPESIARKTGLPLATVERVFKEEDLEYPEIEQYYARVTEEIKNTRVPTDRLLYIRDKRTKDVTTNPSELQGMGFYQSVTGKRYHFLERGARTIRGTVWRYFSGPEICDFPVQGTAADLVSMQVGKLWRLLLEHKDKCLLINEVHDEIVIDCKEEYVDMIMRETKKVLEDVQTSFKYRLGLDFNVPIRVDIHSGSNWLEAKQ